MSYYQAKRTAMAKLYLEQRAAQEQRVGPQDNLLERSRVWLGRYLAQPRQSQIDWRPRFAFTPPKDIDHGHPEIIDCEYSVVEDSFAPVSEGEKPEEASGAAQGSTEHAEG